MEKAYIICGSPGAGKTTYGKQLAEKENTIFLDIDIDIDVATERLVKLALKLSGKDPKDRDSPYFKKHFRQPIYEQLFDIVRDNLPQRSVVIAGPFTKEIQDAEWPKKLAAHLGAPVEIHYVFCDPKIRKERMIKRANPRDTAKLQDWEKYLEYYKGEPFPVCEYIAVDNSAELRI